MQDLQFKSSDKLAQTLAADLGGRMQQTIAEEGSVAIAVSGGRTPIQFFQALSRQPLDWLKVTVTLVDERWVDEQDEASNARLVKEHLLQGDASHAWFIPLKNSATTAVDGYMECENRLQKEIARLHYAVLGMGNDGHCASWFPGSKALSALLADDQQARSYPVTDAPQFAQRMSLTWGFLASCKHLFLHFEGAEKNATFAKVGSITELSDVEAMPVRKLFSQNQFDLTLYRTTEGEE